MKKATLLGAMLFLIIFPMFMFAQEQAILAIHGKNIVRLDPETGDVIDAQFGDLTPLGAVTPKGITQVGEEVWISDQNQNKVWRFDFDGNLVGTIESNLSNIKGLKLVDNQEVWVTNAGSTNGAPGNAVIRFDLNGNYLGNFETNNRSSFDIVDNHNGEVYLSYSSSGSPIERRDYQGNFIDFIVQPNVISFGQQMMINSAGNLLIATFSSPSGIYEYDIASGNQLNYWSQSGARGVIETGNGSILWSSSSGIHRLNPTTGISTTLLSGSGQFFALVSAGGCSTPALAVETPDEVCEGSTVTLTATSNGEDIFWYDSETATNAIHTGATFTTPELTETTSYWVKAVNYGEGESETIEGGARVAPSGNSSSSVNLGTAPWGLTFDADEDFIVNSVDVYLASATPGDLVMQLLDENWNVLQETTVACPAGNASNPVAFEVNVDFEVEAGNRYHLVAASSPTMVREFSSAHAGFPYPLGTAGSVVGGTINGGYANNTVYYFFYNWTITVGTIETCESDLEEVVVTVNPIPEAPTGLSLQSFNEGDTLADLEVTATGTLTWYEDQDGTVELPDTTPLEDGVTYYVSQTINGCESDLFAITVSLLIGIEDHPINGLAVYPNPTSDVLHIQSKEAVTSVVIFDLAGRQLNTVKLMEGKNLDMTSLAAGTYLLRITVGEATRTMKVVKQ
ncbi:MAG TPA: T9SS type A sorting domain-containing protein [Flavobacteriaceae bacterium]|nr:T9SS type A sorting domain-containing protein [Flavobacteriaceae bacterium]